MQTLNKICRKLYEFHEQQLLQTSTNAVKTATNATLTYQIASTPRELIIALVLKVINIRQQCVKKIWSAQVPCNNAAAYFTLMLFYIDLLLLFLVFCKCI